MRAAPRMLVFFLVTLHLQSHNTKYLLLDVDTEEEDEPGLTFIFFYLHSTDFASKDHHVVTTLVVGWPKNTFKVNVAMPPVVMRIVKKNIFLIMIMILLRTTRHYTTHNRMNKVLTFIMTYYSYSHWLFIEGPPPPRCDDRCCWFAAEYFLGERCEALGCKCAVLF